MRAIFLGLAVFVFGAAKQAPLIYTAKLNTHKVTKGETATQIARNSSISISKLAILNPNIDLAKLSVGTIINIAPAKDANSVKHVITGRHSLISKENATIIAATKLPKSPKGHAITVTATKLPKVPVEANDLVHLEHVLPIDIDSDINIQDLDGDVSDIDDDLNEVVPIPSQQSDGNFPSINKSSLSLLWPVETRTISSPWGPRIRTRLVTVKVGKRHKHKKTVMQRFVNNHSGLDLSAPKGNKIFAAMDGQVTTSTLNVLFFVNEFYKINDFF